MFVRDMRTTPEMRFLDALTRRAVRGMTGGEENKEEAICVPDGTTPEMRSLDFGTRSALEG